MVITNSASHGSARAYTVEFRTFAIPSKTSVTRHWIRKPKITEPWQTRGSSPTAGSNLERPNESPELAFFLAAAFSHPWFDVGIYNHFRINNGQTSYLDCQRSV